MLQPVSYSHKATHSKKAQGEAETPFEKADNLSPEPAKGNMQTSTKA